MGKYKLSLTYRVRESVRKEKIMKIVIFIYLVSAFDAIKKEEDK